MPAVSVIIPTFNRAWCLPRAIESVLNQTFQDFELIVVDDGSTDDTIDVLARYPTLRFIRYRVNRGVGAAINAGLAIANADLIALQDSDDEWLPEKLERQVAVMRSADETLGVVYCDQWRHRDGARFLFPAAQVSQDDGIVYGRALDDGLHNIGNQSLLIRRACFEKVGLYDESLRKNEDLDMLIRISQHFRLHRIPEPLLNYYVTPDSVTARSEGDGIATQEALFKKHLDGLRQNPAALAKKAYWIGSYHMRAGNSWKGRKYLLIAALAMQSPRHALAFLISLCGQAAYQGAYKIKS